MKNLILLTLTTLYFFSLNAFSHSGRTNSSGCHTNSITDDYHCHNSESCDYDEIENCNGNCRDIDWLGDGMCDSSLNCSELYYDLGDCDEENSITTTPIVHTPPNTTSGSNSSVTVSDDSSSSTTEDNQTYQDGIAQGIEYGIQHCKDNFEECGLMPIDACHVPIDFFPVFQSTGVVIIPQILVADSLGNMFKYRAELNAIPHSEPLLFELTNAIALEE